MKSIIRYAAAFVLLFFLSVTTVNTQQQCLSFARGIVRPMLSPYIHDGNYTATFIEEGESADLHKTFFKGEKYRLVFAAVDALPKNVRIRLLDENNAIFFDNAEHDYVYVWDFELEATERLIVRINIPDSNETTIRGGCMAVLFGIVPAEETGRRRR